MQQQRRSSETPGETQVCLEHGRIMQQQGTSSETPWEIQACQEQDRAQHCVKREIDPQAPLFDQHVVRSKLSKFHSTLASVQFQKCFTCEEHFPNLNVITLSDQTTECRRCNQDKRIPKLYSSTKNMNPGPVPPQLQVSY